MKDKIVRKFFLGFIQIHILHHAALEPIYGVWMMDELKEHGYNISPGSLYPLLARMEKEGLLSRTSENKNGRIIKYYTTTPLGVEVLHDAKEKARQLFNEIEEGEHKHD